MHEIEIIVDHPSGLHLRPAALFVQAASRYDADIKIRNVSNDSGYQNAKSTMAVMMLRVDTGQTISIQANGTDAPDAIQALRMLIESGFEVDD